MKNNKNSSKKAWAVFLVILSVVLTKIADSFSFFNNSGNRGIIQNQAVADFFTVSTELVAPLLVIFWLIIAVTFLRAIMLLLEILDWIDFDWIDFWS